MSTVALTAATRFTAIDKITAVVKRMGAATMKFSQKTAAGLAMVNRAERKVRHGFDKLLGTFGKLGIAIGLTAILHTMANANIELDASLASLQAITGVTNKEFVAFSKQVGEVARQQKEFAGDTAKAFEVVASAQPILLKNADALGRVTNAAITLSKASGDDLATAAGNLTGVMNQFNLKADQSERVMNALAAGSVYGSANITKVALSMKNFGAVAAGANVSVEQAVALVETLGEKSIFAEEAGTKLRGVLLKLQKSGFGYQSGQFEINDALTEATKKVNQYRTAKEKDAFILKVFGEESITAGKILFQNIDRFKELTSQVTGTNIAFEQAATKANTLQRRLLEVKNAFLNQITSTDQSNKSMQRVKDLLKQVADNMDRIIPAIWTGVKAFIAYKAILVVATIAQTAMNIAMAANPVGLIVIGVIALIGFMTLLVKKYEQWGAAIAFLQGPLGLMTRMIGTIRMHWSKVMEAFRSKGILLGLKAIGAAIVDFFVYPIQQLLKLLAKIPGLGKILNPVIVGLQNIRDKVGVTHETNEKGQPVNPDAEIERVRTERSESVQERNVRLLIETAKGTSAKVLENNGIDLSFGSTLGFAFNNQ